MSGEVSCTEGGDSVIGRGTLDCIRFMKLARKHSRYKHLPQFFGECLIQRRSDER